MSLENEVAARAGVEKAVVKEVASLVSDDLEFVLSDATPDRYGDVVEAKGWELSWFRKNPIALFGHDNNSPLS